MSEEEKVLISRTRIKKRNWLKLKVIAEILSVKQKEPITREDLVEIGLDSTVKYYERELKL
jgi:aryl carrier-like protein